MSWYEEGVDRARKEGERKGRRALVLKLLRARFGELPADIIARLDAADSDELDLWAERFATSSTLDDVLGAA